jgi:NAD(P)-dependent dehydrogenase (short-subunit alcohol dehydrogenase family)
MHIGSSHLLITGSNRGIGRALVDAALARGAARVYAGARDPRNLEELVARAAGRVVPLEIDLTRPETIASAVAQVPTLDLLVKNAGRYSPGALTQSDLDDVYGDMATNFLGTLAVTRAFLPALKRNGEAAAVANVLSVVALSSVPALGGYSASKAAAWSLTQALRGELARKGIRVHAVFPGPVDTDMARDVTLPKTPPAEVARAILDAIEAGDEDIFPDPMSRQVAEAWSASPKSVERMFGARSIDGVVSLT